MAVRPLLAGALAGLVLLATACGGDVAMNVTGPRWRRPISTASALLPLRAPPSSNVSAPVDTLAECTAASPNS